MLYSEGFSSRDKGAAARSACMGAMQRRKSVSLLQRDGGVDLA
jgi:hypothetical protein